MPKSPTKSRAKPGSLVISGGMYRGRKVLVPAVPGLRPTSGRIRQTLFNWLQFDLPGLRVLDLFAGTGALGIEALSRGAAFAEFVEPDANAARSLRHSLQTLQVDNARVVQQSAEQYLCEAERCFDLVFIDPPYAHNLWQAMLQRLAASGRLAANARIYLECPLAAAFDLPLAYQVDKDKSTSTVRYRLLTFAP